jgi:hypothetical protein
VRQLEDRYGSRESPNLVGLRAAMVNTAQTVHVRSSTLVS